MIPADSRRGGGKDTFCISLSSEQRTIVDGALAADLAKLSLVPAIQSVAAQHVHLLAKFGSLRIRPTVGRLKSAATQKLHECGIASLRIWAKGEHMESLPTEQLFLNAFEYVRRHEDEGAVVRIWRMEYAEDVLPF